MKRAAQIYIDKRKLVRSVVGEFDIFYVLVSLNRYTDN